MPSSCPDEIIQSDHTGLKFCKKNDLCLNIADCYVCELLVIVCICGATVSVVWPSLHSPAYPTQSAFIRPSSPVMSHYSMQSYLHCTLAEAVTKATAAG